MGAAKRVYLYTVSAISLLVVSVGLYNLVALVLGELADAFGASVIGGDRGTGREQISLAIALVVVGLPIFAIHWVFVQRGWRGTDEAAFEERHSSLRAFHFGFVATIALAVSTFAALQIVNGALTILLGVDRFGGGGRLTDDVAMVLVAGPIWWYHARRRSADLRHDRLTGASAWLTRLHRYGWSFAGLMFLVIGTSGVVENLASVVIGRSGFGADDRLWLGQLAWSLSAIAVGSALFWFHADDARGVIRDAEIIGEDDRATATRAAYFGVVILVGLTDVGVTIAASIAALGERVLGIADASGMSSFLELVVGPLLVAVPFAVAGWLHWAALLREARGRSLIALASAARLELHLGAGVGLTFLAVGAAQLLGRVIEVIVGSEVGDDFFRREIVRFIALMVVGAALWIPSWTAIVRRRGADPSTERRATTGRGYLFLVVGAALVAAVPSAVFTLYRLIDTILGGRAVALGSDLAIPVAVVIVASLIGAYHGRLVVSDMRFAASQEAEEAQEAEQAEAAAAGMAGLDVQTITAPAVASLSLTLRAPSGTDLVAIANDLRVHLPAGVVLEGLPAGGAPVAPTVDVPAWTDDGGPAAADVT
jgi:hypothetical protein